VRKTNYYILDQTTHIQFTDYVYFIKLHLFKLNVYYYFKLISTGNWMFKNDVYVL